MKLSFWRREREVKPRGEEEVVEREVGPEEVRALFEAIVEKAKKGEIELGAGDEEPRILVRPSDLARLKEVNSEAIEERWREHVTSSLLQCFEDFISTMERAREKAVLAMRQEKDVVEVALRLRFKVRKR